jgi:hypothetical protein
VSSTRLRVQIHHHVAHADSSGTYYSLSMFQERLLQAAWCLNASICRTDTYEFVFRPLS